MRNERTKAAVHELLLNKGAFDEHRFDLMQRCCASGENHFAGLESTIRRTLPGRIHQAIVHSDINVNDHSSNAIRVGEKLYLRQDSKKILPSLDNRPSSRGRAGGWVQKEKQSELSAPFLDFYRVDSYNHANLWT